MKKTKLLNRHWDPKEDCVCKERSEVSKVLRVHPLGTIHVTGYVVVDASYEQQVSSSVDHENP